MSKILSVLPVFIFVSNWVVSIAEYRGMHRGGKEGGGSYTDRFERMQKIEVRGHKL